MHPTETHIHSPTTINALYRNTPSQAHCTLHCNEKKIILNFTTNLHSTERHFQIPTYVIYYIETHLFPQTTILHSKEIHTLMPTDITALYKKKNSHTNSYSILHRNTHSHTTAILYSTYSHALFHPPLYRNTHSHTCCHQCTLQKQIFPGPLHIPLNRRTYSICPCHPALYINTFFTTSTVHSTDIKTHMPTALLHWTLKHIHKTTPI